MCFRVKVADYERERMHESLVSDALLDAQCNLQLQLHLISKDIKVIPT